MIQARTLLAALLLLASRGPEQAPASGAAEIVVTENGSGQTRPCRIHLKNDRGQPQRAPSLPFWKDHFACPGSVRLELPGGTYSYEVECGPEFSSAAGTFEVGSLATRQVKVELERLADLAREGWWSGDLHIHRPPDQIESLMRAEDLHIGPVITWWNSRNLWKDRARPEPALVRFDGDRYLQLLAGEDEREGGALLYFGLEAPLAIDSAKREYPPMARFLAEAKVHPRVHVDVEKPFWWDVPIWVATGQVDTIGLANNHMERSRMSESEAWGYARDTARWPPPRGNGYWSQELYYRLLNCGLRIPPSAGSASGVLENPVGYDRVYVHLDGDLSYDAWWEGLRAGRSFVTNGPLIRVRAAGEWPGHVFKAVPGHPEIELELGATVTSRDPVSSLEIVKDGQVERQVPWATAAGRGSLGSVKFTRSGWFLVRAVADVPHTFRFCSTAPFYVEIGDSPRRISRGAARFFLEWTLERMKRIRLDDPAEREAALAPCRAAEAFWRSLEAKATDD